MPVGDEILGGLAHFTDAEAGAEVIALQALDEDTDDTVTGISCDLAAVLGTGGQAQDQHQSQDKTYDPLFHIRSS